MAAGYQGAMWLAAAASAAGVIAAVGMQVRRAESPLLEEAAPATTVGQR
ncbi:MAG TPA: hypothetical protein VGH27_25165 [Streptosporangiaceae bacterium]